MRLYDITPLSEDEKETIVTVASFKFICNTTPI